MKKLMSLFLSGVLLVGFSSNTRSGWASEEILIIAGLGATAVAASCFVGKRVVGAYHNYQDSCVIDNAIKAVEHTHELYDPAVRAMGKVWDVNALCNDWVQERLSSIAGQMNYSRIEEFSRQLDDQVMLLRKLRYKLKSMRSLANQAESRRYKEVMNLLDSLDRVYVPLCNLQAVITAYYAFFVMNEFPRILTGKSWVSLVQSSLAYTPEYLYDEVHRFARTAYGVRERFPFTKLYEELYSVRDRFGKSAYSCNQRCVRTEKMSHILAMWDAFERVYAIVVQSQELFIERDDKQRFEDRERLIAIEERKARAQEREACAAQDSVRELARANDIARDRNRQIRKSNRLLRSLRDEAGHGCPNRDTMSELFRAIE
ncbi:hypothetical protein HOB95_03745, partial [bacterium]|nr:hypothetical protein [bacterium]